MRKGFDSSKSLTNFADCLVNEGYQFVGRYYNVNNPAKNLTKTEAKTLSAKGLSIVAVWENGSPTAASYFSKAKGISDATAARQYASTVIAQPSATPIYFAVDYDATQAEVAGPITEYFTGVKQVFDQVLAGQPFYSVGVYGSGFVCKKMLDNGLALCTWLAQSSGWLGSGTFADYNIKQRLGINICPQAGTINGDPDESPRDNEGSFKI